MCLLVVLLFSQVDFIIGTILGPKNNVEVAKGFVGYNCKYFVNLFQIQYKIEGNVWSGPFVLFLSLFSFI